MVPGAYAQRQAFVAIEYGPAEHKIPLLLKLGRARALRRLDDHLDGDPGSPISALHTPAAGELLEAGIHLRRTVVLPAPVPGHWLKVDAANHRPRAHGLVRNLAGKFERVVRHEYNIVITVAGAQQGRVVLLPLAWISADLELLFADDPSAELLH